MAKKKTQAATSAKRETRTTTTRTTTKKAAGQATQDSPTPAESPSPKSTARTPRRPANAPTVEPKITLNHDAIAREAYYLWLKRGGDPQANWLEAEHRLQEAAAKARG